MNKDSILSYIKRLVLALFIMVVIPNAIFFIISLGFEVYLNPIIYPIASITGFCVICSSIWFDVKFSDKNVLAKLLSFILLLVILPLSFIYITDLASPVQLTTEYVAEALFGWVFGVCVAFGFKLLLPKKKKV